MKNDIDTQTQDDCRCAQASCGCAGTPDTGCSCDGGCDCRRQCRCDAGCDCAAKS